MTKWILDADAALDSPEAGGKARALARAQRGGLMVPAWVVLSESACFESLTLAERAVLQCGSSSLTCSIEGVTMDAGVRAAIDAAVRDLCPNGELLAVRSSASDEDGAQFSFAGQLESFLNVAQRDVPDRVIAVWRSAFTERTLAYRREHGLAGAPRPPAVILQHMVTPEAAGVAFSADPVSGRRSVAVVSAVRGYGDALVAGLADADTWRVGRGGEILQQTVVGQPASAVLTDDQVRAVAGLARQAARLFGCPQDIEWALADRVVLLQSRPVTSLRTMADPDGCLAIWDNSNIVESYSGVTTPLTFSFTREIYPPVYRQFCRMMGVPGRVIARHDDTFQNVLGLVRGRLYYNLLNWYRILALLPGYRLNRRFMEQMMGVEEPLPDDLVEEIARRTKRGRLVDAVHFARTLGGLLVNYVSLDRRIAAFYRRLDGALAPPSPPLEDCRPDELTAHYRDLRSRLLLEWDAPLVNDFFAMVFYGFLRHLVTRWCGDRSGTLQNDLVGGEGGMVSAEPAILLQRLAQLAARSPALVERLSTGSAAAIRADLDRHEEFLEHYRQYLAKFGDRTVNELKLESVSLHDDPLPLFRAIGSLGRHLTAAQPESRLTPSSSGHRLRTEARARVSRALAGHPLRRLIFGWVLKNARQRVRDRENLRLERTRLFARVRKIFVELGHRFHAMDLIDDARDVLYLEVDEVLAFVDGRSTCTDLRALTAQRRREFARYEEGAAPDNRFETRGPLYQGHDCRRARSAIAGAADERRGLGCSPGVVRGPVRIVTDPRTADLGGRSILVATHTDPGWVMAFPSALGVLVERGSLLSHAAIVARELGIPAVVSLPGVTGWLRDGDWVEMDGGAGTVRRVPRPEEAARVAAVAAPTCAASRDGADSAVVHA
jgi:pyruvate,water dikinase